MKVSNLFGNKEKLFSQKRVGQHAISLFKKFFFDYKGPTQVKSRLLISSIFYAMNF